MKQEQAAQRYAKALYSIATENKQSEAVLNEIREINAAIFKDGDTKLFFTGPVVKAEERKKVLQALFEKKKITEEVRGLLLLLAEKQRFALLPKIVADFQSEVDASQGVARGSVQSATTLFPEDRQKLENTISRYTGKKAVLEYHEDKKLLGGLVAQVGSFTFDDSLESQLRLMREALNKRRAH
jgi:F-type H+-transporting ATPase subunit delta